MAELKPSGVLPDSIADERYVNLDKLLSRLEQIDAERLFIYNINRAVMEGNEELLYELAMQFHITGAEGWFLAETPEQKGELVKNAISLHRKRGTRWAVNYILELLGMGGDILEWWEQEPNGDPYTFDIRIDLGDRPLDTGLVEQLDQLVSTHKNVRSHANYIFFRSSQGSLYTGAGAAGKIKAYIGPLE